MWAWETRICSGVPLKNFALGGGRIQTRLWGRGVAHTANFSKPLSHIGRKYIATPTITTTWDKEIKEFYL